MINLSKNGNWQGGGISYTWGGGTGCAGFSCVVVVVAASVKLDFKTVKKKMYSVNRVFLL